MNDAPNSRESSRDTELESPKLSLFGKKSQGQKRAPKISWSVFKGNASCSVYANDGSNGDKPYRIGFSRVGFNLVVNTIRLAITAKDKFRKPIDNKTGPIRELKSQPSLIIGRDPGGPVFIGFKHQDTALKFDIVGSDYHTLPPVSDSDEEIHENHSLFAASYLDAVDDLVSHYLRETYVKPENPNGGGNKSWNKSGGNRQQYGGGNRQNQSQSNDMDFGDAGGGGIDDLL